MQYLFEGMLTNERLTLLLKLTSVSSEPIKEALHTHFVRGMNEKDAALLNDVKQQNFNRAVKRLNEVAEIVEDIKELDWAQLNNKGYKRT